MILTKKFQEKGEYAASDNWVIKNKRSSANELRVRTGKVIWLSSIVRAKNPSGLSVGGSTFDEKYEFDWLFFKNPQYFKFF